MTDFNETFHLQHFALFYSFSRKNKNRQNLKIVTLAPSNTNFTCRRYLEGKQEGTTKCYGPVDSESTLEFDQKLEGLKNDWKNSESGITNISLFN